MPNSLSRKKDYRQSLLRNLATSLILYEEIKTSEAKAKALKPFVEHLLQVAKKDNLIAKRRLMANLFDENAVKKVFEVFVPRYKNVKSGFIKQYRLGPRVGDSAEMVILRMEKAKEEDKDLNAPKAKSKEQSKTPGKESPAKKK